jgi:branched-chain amino acid transport system ATP-binding protein
VDFFVADRLVKNFGGLRVLNETSLTVKEGTITGLVGPNGSGKSTFFHVVYGLLRPDGGEVYFRGEPITRLPAYRVYSKGLALAFQIPRLFSRLTVLDNLLLATGRRSGESFGTALFRRRHWQEEEIKLAEKARAVLELVELTPLALQPAGELSGGQRKLLEIGRALMADPAMLLLDEPAAGVNPVLGRKIYATLERLRREKRLTFLIIEHRLEMLLDHAHYVYLMDAGRIALAGEPAKVLADPAFYKIYAGESRQWQS